MFKFGVRDREAVNVEPVYSNHFERKRIVASRMIHVRLRFIVKKGERGNGFCGWRHILNKVWRV